MMRRNVLMSVMDWTKISSIDDLIKQAIMTTSSQQFYEAEKPTKSHDGVQKKDSTDFAKSNKNLSLIENQLNQQEPTAFTN